LPVPISHLLGLMRHYSKEVRGSWTGVMRWLVFSLAAGFARSAGATELHTDYLRGSTVPANSQRRPVARVILLPARELPRTTAIAATRRRESCEAATTRRESTP
jgi:hypothetical protein